VKPRLLEMLEMLAKTRGPLTRSWWQRRWDELRDSWSYSFGLSTLFHVAVIVAVGSLWIFSEQKSGVAALDTRWTDANDSPVLEEPVEMAWAKPVPDEAAGGSQTQTASVLSPPPSPREFTPSDSLSGKLPPSWFADGISNDELGTELADLAGWQARLSRIGTGKGFLNGAGSGAGGAFFGMKAAGQSVVYVVDCSSSMNVPHTRSATRFHRLKIELLNSVASMKPNQSFYIIFFNDHPIPMPARTMQPAKPALQRQYLGWMARIRANGMTDPLSSLKMALRLRPDVIYFLTDGNFHFKTAVSLSRIRQSRSVIHTITFGEREAEPLMKSIAVANRGTYRFIP